MTRRADGSRLDNFISSRSALVLAFAWGLAEATVFFIVPDVLLTLYGCRKLKPAINATVAALIGALAGGVLAYSFGYRDPDAARAFLAHIPAISPALISRVADQITDNGLAAVLLGPLKGIPYKLYAVEWGARREGLISLMLISVPARYVRFFLATLAARLIARFLTPLTEHRARKELAILAVLWIAFYGFYFSRFGW